MANDYSSPRLRLVSSLRSDFIRQLMKDGLVNRSLFDETNLAEIESAEFLGERLSYYVQWHLKRAWEPLLFAEENLSAIRQQRDPVAKAEPTLKARKKKVACVTDGGLPFHSFDTLLRELARRSRNTCQIAGSDSLPPKHSNN